MKKYEQPMKKYEPMNSFGIDDGSSPRRIRSCRRCLFDSRIPSINFDESGVCSYCALHDEMDRQFLNQDDEDRFTKDGGRSDAGKCRGKSVLDLRSRRFL